MIKNEARVLSPVSVSDSLLYFKGGAAIFLMNSGKRGGPISLSQSAIAVAGGITAAVCGVASFTILVILALVNCYHHSVCDTVVKCLVIGYLESSVPFQLVLALGFIHNFLSEQENFCKADGFFNNYFMDVLLLFALAISLVLFLTMCGATTSWRMHLSHVVAARLTN